MTSIYNESEVCLHDYRCSFHNYSHFSLLDLIWKAHSCIFPQQPRELAVLGMRTGSDPKKLFYELFLLDRI